MSDSQTDKKNWSQRLDLAEKVGHFTDHDKFLSRSWTYCATGERGVWSPPPTSEIYKLAMNFTYAVEADKVRRAREIYNKIMGIPHDKLREMM